MKATTNGLLNIIPNCYIVVPIPGGGTYTVNMRILPDISDSKSASYNDEVIIGRSFPLKTFSHSENRAVSWTIHFMTITSDDIQRNLKDLYALESCVYPQDNAPGGAPYAPPPLVLLACGNLLTSDGSALRAILKSYSFKAPTDVVWDEDTLLPYRFDVDLQFEVVYSSDELPGWDTIFPSGL